MKKELPIPPALLKYERAHITVEPVPAFHAGEFGMQHSIVRVVVEKDNAEFQSSYYMRSKAETTQPDCLNWALVVKTLDRLINRQTT